MASKLSLKKLRFVKVKFRFVVFFVIFFTLKELTLFDRNQKYMTDLKTRKLTGSKKTGMFQN